MNQNWMYQLTNTTKALLAGCRKTAYDGTILYTPDGAGNYDALWLRDFAYMVEYAGDLMPAEDVRNCIRYAHSGVRKDGWMPDRIDGQGLATYAAGATGAPIGLANLDNTPFLIFAVYFHLKAEPAGAREFWQEIRSDLARGLYAIPRSSCGLVENPVETPHSPYGFTDTVCKTGLLFMESLLYWRALKLFCALDFTQGGHTNADMLQAAEQIEQNIFRLWEKESGLFLAAEKDCRQIDIWGNLYLLYVDFPCPAEIRDKMLTQLFRYAPGYLYHGQIRHLVQGEYWDKLLIDVPHNTYQNGAFWATATGWAVWCLAQKDVDFAANIFADCLAYCNTHGYFECVSEGYQKLPGFVVSGTNLFGVANRLRQEQPRWSALVASYSSQ